MAQQLPLFVPESPWSLPDLSKLPDKLFGAIGVDTETRDPYIKQRGPGWAYGEGRLWGISVSSDHYTGYFPVAPQPGGYDNPGPALRWLKQQLADPSTTKVFANGAYDIGWLGTEGIEVEGPIRDVAYNAALLDEHRISYSLDSLAKFILDEGKDETLLREAAAAWGIKDVKADLWRIPAQYVGAYAEADADRPRRIWAIQQELLRKEELTDLMELESSNLKLLVRMRRRGVRVNIEKTERLRDELKVECEKLALQLKRLTSLKVDPWSSDSLVKAYTSLGIPFQKTEAGNPSFTQGWLDQQPDDLSRLVVRYRKVDKMGSTFMESMILGHAHKGRIHGEFHPLRSDDGGAVSGRFSASNPNLQQVPSRDEEFAAVVRGLFEPEEDEEWLSADYSEQEPRATVHFSALLGLPGAEKAVDYYTNDPTASFHTFVSKLMDKPRKVAKIINLGLFYGMGEPKLCRSLGLPTVMVETEWGFREEAGPEGKEILEKYHAEIPFIRAIQKAAKDRANSRGYIVTLLKRRCRFPFWEPKGMQGQTALPRWKAERQWPNRILVRSQTRKAMNRLVQGSSADMLKKAMHDVDAAGFLPMLTIHDELAFSVPKGDAGKKIVAEIKDIMEHCVSMRVPLKVDCEVGPTWGEAK